MKTWEAWAGIDAGKEHHHVWVMDEDGQRLLSRRVANDELELTNLIGDVVALADQLTWATDLAGGPAALVIAILLGQGQTVRYMSGVAVNRPLTVAKERPTPRTLRSLLTRLACVGTYASCARTTR